MNLKEVTPCLMVKNEEYWIHFVLRDLLKVFDRVILLDTGSTDETKRIALDTVSKVGGILQLIEMDYGDDAFLIGQGRNLLRKECPTKWMFLVDGDEIYLEPQLRKMEELDIPEQCGVVMAGLFNIEDVNGTLMNRVHDMANRDILFAPDIKWNKTDYPFESYGLSGSYPMAKVHYFPALQVFAYHMRHTLRSSKNFDTFFRRDKLGYFPYKNEYSPLPVGLFGAKLVEFNNPYLNG